eukprot:9334574-Pyramimonas_sp.AAC.1
MTNMLALSSASEGHKCSTSGPPMGYHGRPEHMGFPLRPLRPRMGYHPRPGYEGFPLCPAAVVFLN